MEIALPDWGGSTHILAHAGADSRTSVAPGSSSGRQVIQEASTMLNRWSSATTEGPSFLVADKGLMLVAS